MTRILKIAGDERYPDLERKTLSISKALTYLIDTCTFNIKGARPQEESEVIVEDGNRRFAGIVKKVEQARVFPDKSNVVWKVDCDDYTALVDAKLVVERYIGWRADEIFIDIVEKYCPGFTTNGVQTGAPVVEDSGDEFNYVRPSECFRWLCDYVGWHWQPDYYKDLHFFSLEEIAVEAPMKLDPGGKFVFGRPKIDTRGLRNRVYVRGGTMLSDFQPVSWKADGEARQWVLPWGPHETKFDEQSGYIGEGGVAKKLGAEFLVEDESTVDYILNYQEKYIRCAEGKATPVEGTIISYEAKQGLDVITVVEDFDSQAAIAAIQGGDGVYEHVIVDDALVTLEAAEAAGTADLREHANPKIVGDFTTEVEGWEPGQLVPINLSDRGINGTYIVQKVTSIPQTPTIWTHKIEYGGRLLGIADFLKALVSAQQKKVNETDVMHKIAMSQETVQAEDELDLTERTPPWYCGDADAICGFAECAGFLQIAACGGIGIKTGYEGKQTLVS